MVKILQTHITTIKNVLNEKFTPQTKNTYKFCRVSLKQRRIIYKKRVCTKADTFPKMDYY